MTEHPDFLRSPKNMFNADPRSTGFAVFGEQGVRPKTLEDHYDAVAQMSLHNGVPRQIVIKFETAKNLNLFSWFVYRFHSAARSHVYECLEFALRIRFGDELLAHEDQKRRTRYEREVRSNPQIAKPYKPIDKERFRPTMHPLLKYAIEIGALKNENFTAWQLKTRVRARSRMDIEAIQRMKLLGLSAMQTDNSELSVTDEDRDHDYLGSVLEAVPFLRNHYAHGTGALDDKSLSALRLASEIINQVFPRSHTP